MRADVRGAALGPPAELDAGADHGTSGCAKAARELCLELARRLRGHAEDSNFARDLDDGVVATSRAGSVSDRRGPGVDRAAFE